MRILDRALTRPPLAEKNLATSLELVTVEWLAYDIWEVKSNPYFSEPDPRLSILYNSMGTRGHIY